jgi:cytochrome c553
MSTLHRAVVLSGVLVAAAAAYAQTPPPRGDAARGAPKAAVCLQCHGPAPGAPLAGMPSLAGQQEEFLVLQMILLREELRDVPVMAGTLKHLGDRDLIDIAAYFNSLKPYSPDGNPDAQRREYGAALSQKMGCGSCHMNDYHGQRQVPRLVNQREDYLAATLKAYRDNKRSGTDTSMNAVMYQVTDGDIQALAHYLANR